MSSEIDGQDLQSMDNAIQWGQQHGADFVAHAHSNLGDKLADHSYGGPEHSFPPMDSADQEGQSRTSTGAQHTENWMAGQSPGIQRATDNATYDFALPSSLIRDASDAHSQHLGGELAQQQMFFSEQEVEQAQYWSQRQRPRYQPMRTQYPQDPLRTTGQVFSPLDGQFGDQRHAITRQAQHAFPEAPAQSSSYRQREAYGSTHFRAEHPQSNPWSSSSQIAQMQADPQRRLAELLHQDPPSLPKSRGMAMRDPKTEIFTNSCSWQRRVATCQS